MPSLDLQLRQQLGADRQQIAARQRQDLADVAETRAHHLGVDAEVLVVGVDARHRLDAGIVGAGVAAASSHCAPAGFLYQS